MANILFNSFSYLLPLHFFEQLQYFLTILLGILHFNLFNRQKIKLHRLLNLSEQRRGNEKHRLYIGPPSEHLLLKQNDEEPVLPNDELEHDSFCELDDLETNRFIR